MWASANSRIHFHNRAVRARAHALLPHARFVYIYVCSAMRAQKSRPLVYTRIYTYASAVDRPREIYIKLCADADIGTRVYAKEGYRRG